LNGPIHNAAPVINRFKDQLKSPAPKITPKNAQTEKRPATGSMPALYFLQTRGWIKTRKIEKGSHYSFGYKNK